MKTGASIVVWSDGLIRVTRGITEEKHVENMAVLHNKLSCAFSEDPEPEKFPGFPPGSVGYCAMGHTEIWTKEVACPLCAMITERNNFRTLCQKDTAAIKDTTPNRQW